MIRGVLGISIIMVFFLVPVAAQTSPSPWSWNNYMGTSYWNVQVTENEASCGGGITTDTFSITISHNLDSAVMGNVGHGAAPGSFISPNILHMPSRTVSDPPGSSTLSAYDIFFTTDCSAFAGKYTWTYHGPDGYSCSGSTALSGTTSEGCPAVPVIPTVASGTKESFVAEIASARSNLNEDLMLRYYQTQLEDMIFTIDRPELTTNDPLYQRNVVWAKDELAAATDNIKELEPAVEAKYTAILDRDPKNFWANWDLAELKKAQGNYQEYFSYTNKALSNKDISRDTQQQVKKTVAGGLGLSEFPTTDNSYFIRRMSTDAAAIQSVYGIDVGKGEADTEPLRIFAFWNQPLDAVNVVGLPRD
jgi:hypothetical protein